jgi:hypothetical protein
MSEQAVETTEGPDEEIAAEVETLTQTPGEQQAERIKSALIAAKKGEKAAKKRISELEPIAARATEINNQLAQVQPVIQAVMTNPKLRAEALRMAGGTHASASTTEQPLPDDDPDASAIAEELNMYLADGVTPDVARGRRVLSRLDARTGRVADERIRPLAGVTLDARAQANLSKAMAETDDDGTPMATEESIREVAAQLPAQLLADPKVVDLVLNSAIGIDRRKHRTPKAATPEPLYFASAGTRRQAAPALSCRRQAGLCRGRADRRRHQDAPCPNWKKPAAKLSCWGAS